MVRMAAHGDYPGKLVDAVLQPDSKFDDYISRINEEIRIMNELKDAGHIAQAADMMEVVTDTGTGLSSSLIPSSAFKITDS
jgi:hypothetical protein